MKTTLDYSLRRKLMEEDQSSDDGESDGAVSRESIAALRQMAALATCEANRLEGLLPGPRERALLTMEVPLAGTGTGCRKTAPMLPDVRFVRQMIRHRQMRKHYFDDSLFGEPAWDMLLDLTAASIDGKRVSVTSLCIASGVPATTALRWITVMQDHGLFERSSDPIDRRRSYVSLTPKALRAMTDYFAMVQARR